MSSQEAKRTNREVYLAMGFPEVPKEMVSEWFDNPFSVEYVKEIVNLGQRVIKSKEIEKLKNNYTPHGIKDAVVIITEDAVEVKTSRYQRKPSSNGSSINITAPDGNQLTFKTKKEVVEYCVSQGYLGSTKQKYDYVIKKLVSCGYTIEQ